MLGSRVHSVGAAAPTLRAAIIITKLLYININILYVGMQCTIQFIKNTIVVVVAAAAHWEQRE